jgi:hypothetical protein
VIEQLLQAERLLVHGMVDQAERIYATAVEHDPRNSIAVVGLAKVALERGDDRLAYTRACEALAIDPQNAAALRLEARLSEVFASRGEPVDRPSVVAPSSDEPVRRDRAPEPASPEPAPDARPSEQVVFTRNPTMAEHQRMEEARTHTAESTPDPTPSEPERRPGFFKRIFGA